MCIGMRLCVHVSVCARVLLWLNCMSRIDPDDLWLQGATYILGFIIPLSIHMTCDILLQ